MSFENIVRPKDRMVAGVCAGIAREYGWDVNLVRILTVVGAIFTASSVVPIAYLVAWAFLPEEGSPKARKDLPKPSADPRVAPVPPQAWQQPQPAQQSQEQTDYR